MIGGVLGAAGFGAGGLLGGAIGGKVAGVGVRAGIAKAFEQTSVAGTRAAARSLIPRWISKSLPDKAKDAQSIYQGFGGAMRSWGRDISDNGGGVRGFIDGTANFVDLIARSAVSAGVGDAAVGAYFPSTRDDAIALWKNNLIRQIHPINTPVQILGGFAGGAF